MSRKHKFLGDTSIICLFVKIPFLFILFSLWQYHARMQYVLSYTTSLSSPTLLGSPNLSPSYLCTLYLKISDSVSLTIPWGIYNSPSAGMTPKEGESWSLSSHELPKTPQIFKLVFWTLCLWVRHKKNG